MDTRRSHIPKSKLAKFQQLKWAVQGDRKIRAQELQERDRKLSGRVWLGRRKREGAGLPPGGPCGTDTIGGARPTPLPRPARVWQRGGSPGLP